LLITDPNIGACDNVEVVKSSCLGPGRHIIRNQRLQSECGPTREPLQYLCGENREESDVPSNSGN